MSVWSTCSVRSLGRWGGGFFLVHTVWFGSLGQRYEEEKGLIIIMIIVIVVVVFVNQQYDKLISLISFPQAMTTRTATTINNKINQ